MLECGIRKAQADLPAIPVKKGEKARILAVDVKWIFMQALHAGKTERPFQKE